MFPTLLDQMAKNLAWTSALGDALYNQQAAVMASIQRLRKQAHAAGNLKTTQQQTVTTQNHGGQQVIVIQPANPPVLYVPQYNPTAVYATLYQPPGTARARCWPRASSHLESAWRWALHSTIAAAV